MPTHPRRGSAMNAVITIVAIVAALAIGRFFLVNSAHGATSGWYEDLDDGLDQAAKEHRPAVVMFTADWCGPCRNFKSEVLTHSMVTALLEREFVCVKIDLTDRGSPNNAVAQGLQVRGIPALHMYDGSGRFLGEYSGQHVAGPFLDWLRATKAQTIRNP